MDSGKSQGFPDRAEIGGRVLCGETSGNSRRFPVRHEGSGEAGPLPERAEAFPKGAESSPKGAEGGQPALLSEKPDVPLRKERTLLGEELGSTRRFSERPEAGRNASNPPSCRKNTKRFRKEPKAFPERAEAAGADPRNESFSFRKKPKRVRRRPEPFPESPEGRRSPPRPFRRAPKPLPDSPEAFPEVAERRRPSPIPPSPQSRRRSPLRFPLPPAPPPAPSSPPGGAPPGSRRRRARPGPRPAAPARFGPAG